MNRSFFLAGSASATLLPFIGARALAQGGLIGGVGKNIAEEIATHLAQTAISKGLDAIGLGSIWDSLEGSSDHSAQILEKLDQISQQLQGISTQIGRLQDSVDAQFAKQTYDTVVGPVQALINANKTLTIDFEALFQAALNGNDVKGTLNQIGLDMPPIYGGLSAWNAALTGETMTSVIVAANRVSSSNPDFYTQESAKRFQDLWDLFDAQQAMTVCYLCEYYNTSNQHFRVPNTVRAYLQNRQRQVRLLRGQQREVTKITVLSIRGTPRSLEGRFSGPALPANTIVARKPPYLMWQLQLAGPIAQGTRTYDLACDAYYAAVKFQNDAADSARGQFDRLNYSLVDGLEFNRATGPQVVDLIAAAGGASDGGGGGHFVDALNALGFVFPPNVSSIWGVPEKQEDPRTSDMPVGSFECKAGSLDNTLRRSGNYFSGNDLFREGDSAELPSGDPDVLGGIIYCRPTHGEYFYQ